MAECAVILISFNEKELGVTLYNDKRWLVTGDPKKILSVDGGNWSFSVTTGTELIALKEVQIILVGWNLSSNEGKGTAFLFPETANSVGGFTVTYKN